MVQASKFELVIDLPIARALGLEVQPTLQRLTAVSVQACHWAI